MQFCLFPSTKWCILVWCFSTLRAQVTLQSQSYSPTHSHAEGRSATEHWCQPMITRGSVGFSLLPRDASTHGQARQESSLQYSSQGLNALPLHCSCPLKFHNPIELDEWLGICSCLPEQSLHVCSGEKNVFAFCSSSKNTNQCLQQWKKVMDWFIWSSPAVIIKERVWSEWVLVAVVRFSRLAVDKKELFFPCLIEREPF